VASSERSSLDEQVLAIMSKQSEQLVDGMNAGFQGNQQAIGDMKTDVVQANSDLGDRFERAMGRNTYIVIVALVIVGGLVGLSITLPDGTRVEPSVHAAEHSRYNLDAASNGSGDGNGARHEDSEDPEELEEPEDRKDLEAPEIPE